MSKRKVVILSSPVLWVLLILLGVAMVPVWMGLRVYAHS